MTMPSLAQPCQLLVQLNVLALVALELLSGFIKLLFISSLVCQVHDYFAVEDLAQILDYRVDLLYGSAGLCLCLKGRVSVQKLAQNGRALLET